jgi:hypothetical protein
MIMEYIIFQKRKTKYYLKIKYNINQYNLLMVKIILVQIINIIMEEHIKFLMLNNLYCCTNAQELNKIKKTLIIMSRRKFNFVIVRFLEIILFH